MKAFLIWSAILIIIGCLIWYRQAHSCSICHRFHRHGYEFIECEECSKRFCADRISRYEKIIEDISGVLGVTTRTIDTRESLYRDHPCGFEYITTIYHGSSSSHFYCSIHKSSRRRWAVARAASWQESAWDTGKQRSLPDTNHRRSDQSEWSTSDHQTSEWE